MLTTDASFTTFSATTTTPVRRADRDRIMGLILMAVVPALFWTAIVAAAAPLIGFTVSFTTLGLIAGGIATFLASVCCAVTGRAN